MQCFGKKVEICTIAVFFTIFLYACTYLLAPQSVNHTQQPITVFTPTLETLTPASPHFTLPPLQINTAIAATKRPPPLPHTHYEITAVLDNNQHHLVVNETITYTHRANDTLNELLLMVEPNRYLDVFKLNKMHWKDDTPIDDYTLTSNQMRIPLRSPLATGEQIVIILEYELTLPAPIPNPYTRPVPFGYTKRQTNLVDWYPFIAPYQSGKGWLAHKAGFFGEHLVYETASFQVNLSVLGQSASNAIPTTSKIENNSNLIIVASSYPVIDGEWYRYNFENARSFAWSVSQEYIVKQKNAGNVIALSYAFPLQERAGEATLEATADALILFSDLFGSYPHSTLSAVEADFLDGMEYDGLYFLSNGFYNLYIGSPSEYLIAIAAHETAHQWWYGIVGNDQAQDPWLDEALCTYSERLFYEHYYPEALDWWWTYRIKYYEPKGWINGSIYSYSYTTEAYRAYRDAVYLNGALFLEELRNLIGDETFFTFLKDYASQYAGKIADTSNFLTLLKSHTQVDLEPLLKKYFSSP